MNKKQKTPFLVKNIQALGLGLWRSMGGYFKSEPHEQASRFLQEEWQQGHKAVRIAMGLGAVIFLVRGFLRIFTGVLPEDLVVVEGVWRFFISGVLFYIVLALKKNIAYVVAQRLMVWYVFFLITGLVVAVFVSPQRSAYTLFPIALICLMATALWLEGRLLVGALVVALTPVFCLLQSGVMTNIDASNYYFYIPLSIVLGVVLRHGRFKTAFHAFLLRQQLADQARHDSLTGLLNRAGWDVFVEKSLKEADPLIPNSLMYLDLDCFKKVNDTLGHPVGDELLKALAGVMKEQIRKRDVLARFGGEEFVMFLPDTHAQEAVFLAERIRTAVALNHTPTKATVSIGVAEIYPHESIEEAMSRADEALLTAKRQGRNQVVLNKA